MQVEEFKPAPSSPAVPSPLSDLRYSHRALPGGGRIFVTRLDGTPVGVLRYELEEKGGLAVLFKALGSVLQGLSPPEP